MNLPEDWIALLALVFLLGARHGVDADHLATIDGLTRHNLRQAPSRARWCGALFSLGHGAVVVAIALGVGVAAHRWQVPGWMEDVGAGVSIGFLTVLGLLNLRAVLLTAPDAVVAPVGARAALLARLQSASHPVAIGAVGALFALSFDTMGQAALFAVTATRHGGAAHALALGLVFTAGMLIVDGINGMWIARLLLRADRRARIASRVMGLAVAGTSLMVAALGMARWLRADVAAWYEGKEVAAGMALIALITLAFLLAIGLSRLPRAAASAAAQSNPAG